MIAAAPVQTHVFAWVCMRAASAGYLVDQYESTSYALTNFQAD